MYDYYINHGDADMEHIAMFDHGPERVRVTARTDCALYPVYAVETESEARGWIVQAEYRMNADGRESAIEDARTWYPA